MKWKLIGIFGVIVMLLAAAAVPKIEAEMGESSRVHQHLTARRDTGCGCAGTELCSHLPLVVIDTKGQTVPGEVTGIADSFGQQIYSTASDGSSTINVDAWIIDNQGRNNHPGDDPAYTARGELRIRGHSSRRYPKLPYLLNFVDDSGMDRSIPVMGMDAHHEWALHGPILDKSLIRNYMWYNIAGEVMEYAPNCRFCELILNGSYEGLYLMVETITDGDGCRLNLSVSAKNTEGSGYLLRVDRPREADLESIRDIYSYAERINRVFQDVAIRYPGKNKLTEEFKRDIELNYASFEKALYSYDYDSKAHGYKTWIDTDSFVDYFILNEFTKNSDAGNYSTYLYKQAEEKFKLCVWDFNNSCDGYQEHEMETAGLYLVECNWYFMLLKDEEFAERVIRRYRELRRTVLSEEYLLHYIDETLDWLGPAVERNNRRWADAIENWKPLAPEDRNLNSHQEAVEQLKGWITQRGRWLDAHIDAIRQYCHPSRNKKFNH